MNKNSGLHRNKIRVLIGISEIDGHDRGPKYVTTSLKNAGMEVVLITYKVIEDVVSTAIQEDVDIIGIACYTGGHLATIADLMKLLREKRQEHIMVLLGGIIPTEDRPVLKEMGVDEIFGPGTPVDKIIDYISSQLVKT